MKRRAKKNKVSLEDNDNKGGITNGGEKTGNVTSGDITELSTKTQITSGDVNKGKGVIEGRDNECEGLEPQ